MEESLWLLSDLAAKLKAVIANAGQEIQRCPAYSAYALSTMKEPTAPNLHFCNLNLHFYNDNMALSLLKNAKFSIKRLKINISIP